jgi:hypothetical protein
MTNFGMLALSFFEKIYLFFLGLKIYKEWYLVKISELFQGFFGFQTFGSL